MIVLTAQTLNGAPCEALSGSFDELGGTIGRGPTNQLVLPDPDRSVSRVHAQILYRKGTFAIVDQGSNPVLVNGRAVGSGHEHVLAEGDEVQVGGYVLKVAYGQASTAPDPFADLFGPADSVFGKESTPASAPLAPIRAAPPATSASASPFAPALGARSAVAPAAPSGFGIPEDWDPFAPDANTGVGLGLGPPPSGGGQGGNRYAADPALSAPSRADSLDALFGLGGAAATSSDPFAALPASAAPVAQPNMAGDADPLRALFAPAPPTAAPVADHASDLNTPWRTPTSAPRSAPPTAATGQTFAQATPPGAVLSWNNPTRDAKVVTLPGVHRNATPAEMEPEEHTRIVVGRSTPGTPNLQPTVATPVATPLRSTEPAAGRSQEALTPSAAPASPLQAPAAGTDAMLAALLHGLGMPDLRVGHLGVEQMQLLGQLLREATRGAVELLVARAALKREMRAAVTMIAARENNPLKFSPTVEAALQHLLGPVTPGFMAPADAMRDAFDDLRAHQLATMAGMRAALEGVLQRFDPAVLEGKLTRRSTLSALFSGSRKAELWELFQALYTQLSAEAADDFQELFGKAFRLAYESHIDELQRGSDR